MTFKHPSLSTLDSQTGSGAKSHQNFKIAAKNQQCYCEAVTNKSL